MHYWNDLEDFGAAFMEHLHWVHDPFTIACSLLWHAKYWFGMWSRWCGTHPLQQRHGFKSKRMLETWHVHFQAGWWILRANASQDELFWKQNKTSNTWTWTSTINSKHAIYCKHKKTRTTNSTNAMPSTYYFDVICMVPCKWKRCDKEILLEDRSKMLRWTHAFVLRHPTNNDWDLRVKMNHLFLNDEIK